MLHHKHPFPTSNTTNRPSARLIALSLLAAVVLISFALTHVPLQGTPLDAANAPREIEIFKTIFHVVAYATMTFLTLLAILPATVDCDDRSLNESARASVVIFAAVCAYAMLDEITQPFCGRRFEVIDVLANLVGCVSGHIAYLIADGLNLRDRLDEMNN